MKRSFKHGKQSDREINWNVWRLNSSLIRQRFNKYTKKRCKAFLGPVGPLQDSRFSNLQNIYNYKPRMLEYRTKIQPQVSEIFQLLQSEDRIIRSTFLELVEPWILLEELKQRNKISMKKQRCRTNTNNPTSTYRKLSSLSKINNTNPNFHYFTITLVLCQVTCQTSKQVKFCVDYHTNASPAI